MRKIKWYLLLALSAFFLFGCTKGDRITSIEVEQNSVKESYTLDDFDLSKINLIVNLANNTFKRVTINDTMLSLSDLEKLKTIGRHTVTITYQGYTTTLIINIIDNPLEAKLKLIYQKAVSNQLVTETYEEWLASIKGADGVSIRDVKVNLEGHLIITLSNSQTIDAGLVITKDELEMRVSEGYIQWKYKMDQNWNDLISLSDLDGHLSNGMSAYETYKKYYPDYQGTEEDWINDLVNGKLVTEVQVTFMANGGKLSVDNIMTIAKGEIINLPTPSKLGYRFLGWYLNDETLFTDLMPINKDIILHAKWEYKPIEITFLVKSGMISNALVDLEVAFERDYPFIDVKITSISGSYDDIRSTILFDIESKNKDIADLVIGYPDHFAEYYSAGALVNLQDFIDDQDYGYTSEEINDFIGSYLAENRGFDDNNPNDLYGLPFNKSTEVMIYNKTAFQALFGDAWESKIPTTWQEVETVSQEIITKVKAGELDHTFNDFGMDLRVSDYLSDPNKIRFIPFGYDSSENAFITLTRQFGGAYTERINIEKGYVRFNNPESKAAMTYFQDLNNRGIFGAADNFGASYTSNAFQHIQVLMTVGSSAAVIYNRPDNYYYELGVAPIPYYNDDAKHVIQQGTNIAMLNRNSVEEKLASWLFMKFLLRPENTAQLAMDTGGYLPVRKSAYETSKYQQYLTNPPVDKMYFSAAANVVLNDYIGRNYNLFLDDTFVGSKKIRTEVGSLFNRIIVQKANIEESFIDSYNCLYGLVD